MGKKECERKREDQNGTRETEGERGKRMREVQRWKKKEGRGKVAKEDRMRKRGVGDGERKIGETGEEGVGRGRGREAGCEEWRASVTSIFIFVIALIFLPVLVRLDSTPIAAQRTFFFWVCDIFKSKEAEDKVSHVDVQFPGFT